MMFPVFRTEVEKQVRRKRTLVSFLVAAGVPILIAFAVNNRPARGRGFRREGGVGLFRLALQSGPVLAATALSAMSGLLLVVIVAMFAGDSIAGEASWGNLRYTLMRPVTRVRLLLNKLVVTVLLTWGVTIVAVVGGLIIGTILFGWHDLNVALPLGPSIHQSTGDLVNHLAIGTAYVAFGFSGAIGLGIMFSTMTDTPSGAIGGAIGVYIISQIMNGIDTLGRLRYGFPTHYGDAWESMFTSNTVSHDMWAGVIVQACWLVGTIAIAAWWFHRKDIRS